MNVYRDGKKLSVKVALEERPPPEQQEEKSHE
jgi:hypothetical protein